MPPGTTPSFPVATGNQASRPGVQAPWHGNAVGIRAFLAREGRTDKFFCRRLLGDFLGKKIRNGHAPDDGNKVLIDGPFLSRTCYFQHFAASRD